MNNGAFKKGQIPHNKGKKLVEYIDEKGLEKIKQTQFKKGETYGSEHPSWTGGVQNMKHDCIHIWVDVNKRIRRPRQNYKDVYGKIPKGYVIYHIDNNKDNDHYTNLEAISRAELLKRNRLNKI